MNKNEAPEGTTAVATVKMLRCYDCCFRHHTNCDDWSCDASTRADKCNVVFVKKE